MVLVKIACLSVNYACRVMTISPPLVANGVRQTTDEHVSIDSSSPIPSPPEASVEGSNGSPAVGISGTETMEDEESEKLWVDIMKQVMSFHIDLFIHFNVLRFISLHSFPTITTVKLHKTTKRIFYISRNFPARHFRHNLRLIIHWRNTCLQAGKMPEVIFSNYMSVEFAEGIGNFACNVRSNFWTFKFYVSLSYHPIMGHFLETVEYVANAFPSTLTVFGESDWGRDCWFVVIWSVLWNIYSTVICFKAVARCGNNQDRVGKYVQAVVEGLS